MLSVDPLSSNEEESLNLPSTSSEVENLQDGEIRNLQELNMNKKKERKKATGPFFCRLCENNEHS